MPIIKSAKKRVKVARKAAARNQRTKRALRQGLKAFEAAAKSGKKLAESHAGAQSVLDIAAKKGLLHKNKLARKKRQLAKMAKSAGQKIAGVKKAGKAAKPLAAQTSRKEVSAAKPKKTAKTVYKKTKKPVQRPKASK